MLWCVGKRQAMYCMICIQINEIARSSRAKEIIAEIQELAGRVSDRTLEIDNPNVELETSNLM
jgi:hypothetical protein